MKFLKSKWFPYCFISLLVLPSIVWIFLDNHVWPWDPAWYGEVSVDLYYKLTHSFVDWPKAMLMAFGAKAPGIAWIGQFFVPLAVFTGSVDRALLLSVVLSQWITLWLVYVIVLQVSNMRRGVAIAACLMMAGAPLFVGLGHHYFVESLQLLAVTLFAFIVIRMKDWSRYKTIVALTFVLSLAMIIKITSPLYIVMPAIVVIFNFFQPQRQISFKEYFKVKKHVIFFVAVCIFLLSVCAWYLTNGYSIFEFMHQATSGSLSELYGRRADFFTKFYGWLVYFVRSFFTSISVIFVGLLIVALITKVFLVKPVKLGKLFTLMAGVSLLSIVTVLLSFSLQINEETRYLLPLLIYVAFLLSWLLCRVNNKWVEGLTVTIFLLQFVTVHGNALGIFQDETVYMRGWDTRVESDLTAQNIVNFIIKETCNVNTVNRTNVIGVEMSSFNANSVEYYAMQKKLVLNYPCYYTSLGYAENSSEHAYNRLKNLIQAPYFITVSQNNLPPPDALNAVSKPVLDLIQKDPDFRETNSSESVRIFENSSYVKHSQ